MALAAEPPGFQVNTFRLDQRLWKPLEMNLVQLERGFNSILCAGRNRGRQLRACRTKRGTCLPQLVTLL